MTPEIFSASGAWTRLDPIHAVILRCLAPAGVFTDAHRSEFRSTVASRPDLLELEDGLFSDDKGLLDKLPVSLRGSRRLIITLLMVSYGEGPDTSGVQIRFADPRVRIEAARW